MRRPVVFLFLFFAAGIAVEYRLMIKPLLLLVPYVVSILTYIIFNDTGFVKRHMGQLRLGALLAATLLLGGCFLYLAETRQDPLETKAGSLQTIEGRIITVQSKDENYRRLLITSEGVGKRLIQVQGPMEPPEELIGKWAVIRGEVVIPTGQRNPGLFDYKLYLKTRGVRVILQCNSGQISLTDKPSSQLFSMVARLKYGFLNKLVKEMKPDAYGMMVGMLFGDCSFISDDVYASFQKNGVAHILSVSGIHVAIVYLFVSRILGNRKTRGFYLTASLLLLLYGALSEFSPCVVRSVVMILIHIFSKVSYRRYDFMACTAASALGMLAFNPFYLFNTGFQLSYLAVLWLAALIPWSERRIAILEENGMSELLTELLRYVSPLVIIQFGMALVTAYLFNYFSVASFFVNPPIIVISGLIIPLGIFLIPVSYLGGIPFGVGAQAAELLTDAMIWFNGLFYLPGISFFVVAGPPLLLLALFYGLSFYLSSEGFRVQFQRKNKRAIRSCVAVIVSLCLLFSFLADNGYGSAELVFIDVGQGDCLFLQTPEGINILIDGGGSMNYSVGEKTLLPYLLKRGVTSVDLAVVTHLHNDHFLGIEELAGCMKIKQLGVYEANKLREQEILDSTGLDSRNMRYLGEGDTIRIGNEVRIEVLYPEKRTEREYEELLLEEKDENKSSLILKVFYGDLTVLMTGDLGIEGEEELIDYYRYEPSILTTTVLKVGHHGSRYSTGDAFLEAVDPEIAVFQVGKNNFGHPHPTVIEKCTKKGIMVYRNDRDGAVIFDRKGQTWHIRTMLPKSMHLRE
jgi:competence protein ComEC